MESKDTRNSNISSNQFYGNNKVMQPRTPLSSQSRKTSRDNQNDGGFPSSPNSSGSHLGLNHEVKDVSNSLKLNPMFNSFILKSYLLLTLVILSYRRRKLLLPLQHVQSVIKCLPQKILRCVKLSIVF